MRKTFLLLLLAVLLAPLSFAQKIDNLSSHRDIKSERYFRFNYDNDYFAATDRNYTQGYSFELVTPYFKSNPANYLFLNPQDSYTRYGLAVEHIGFTPDRYDEPAIQVGDRPFAAAIMLKSFIIATDSIKRTRFTSSFNLGIIGPAAFGKEMQVEIHRATGNRTPRGWGNQIKNDLVLNYEIGYEKQLFHYQNYFAIQAQGNLKAGTLFTNASIGLNTTVGIINNPFTTMQHNSGFKLYAYAQPLVTAVAYDATLQGGLFNDNSPYTIAASHVERFTAQLNYGIVFRTRTLYFEYTRSRLTREFATGNTANYGGIRIGFTF
ncbi:MAG: lipid A deacylase LpxR family protein [Nonlabens sp.]|uniref:lipid A deacylase LpxR family protein n=1 Tax=Nonlabens sp. TaxID=1888209 RepID=UPI003EF480E4